MRVCEHSNFEGDGTDHLFPNQAPYQLGHTRKYEICGTTVAVKTILAGCCIKGGTEKHFTATVIGHPAIIHDGF